MVGFVAVLLYYTIAVYLLPSSDYRMVTLCAVIALIPNPDLILSIGELSKNYTLSGMMRLISAIVALI